MNNESSTSSSEQTLGPTPYQQLAQENLPESQRLPPAALLPDAPIYQLLSLRHNPLVANMSQQQLIDFIRKLKENATSAPTLSASMARDSEAVKPKRQPNAAAAKRAALLDDL